MKQTACLLLFFLAFTILSIHTAAQNVGIGTASPHPSAQLDLSANTKGLLIPRLTTAERTGISSPANGLMVYDSSQRSFFIYKSTKGWRKADFDLPYTGTDSSLNTFRLENTKLTGPVWGIYSSVASNDNFSTALYARSKYGAGIRAVSDSGTGIDVVGYTAGIQASVSEGTGTPIIAFNNSTAPFKTALRALTNSPSGQVILAESFADSGSTTAVNAYSFSRFSNAIALKGEARGGTGVYGISDSGTAVYGFSRRLAGLVTGVSGETVSSTDSSAGVSGKATAGYGVKGASVNGVGVYGVSNTLVGVYGNAPLYGVYATSAGKGVAAVGGTIGVEGITFSTSSSSYGVYGNAQDNGTGVLGSSNFGTGVRGQGPVTGVWGFSAAGNGVFGEASAGGIGVRGNSVNNYAVYGVSSNSTGVYGQSNAVVNGVGVYGTANKYGVWGRGETGIYGETNILNGTALWGQAGNNQDAVAIRASASGINAMGIRVAVTGSAAYAVSASHDNNGTVAKLSSNSSSAAEQLLIEETENDFARIKFKNTNAPFWVIGPYAAATGVAANARFNIFYSNLNNGGGGDAFVMDGNGNLTIAGNAFKPGGGAWNVPSDRRLKKNIIPFTDGLQTLLDIKPVHFQYNGRLGLPQQPQYIGVVAQEVQEVAPYMIRQITASGNDYLQLDPNAFTYLLINAVKELHQQNQLLQQQNSQLANEITRIKKRLGLN